MTTTSPPMQRYRVTVVCYPLGPVADTSRKTITLPIVQAIGLGAAAYLHTKGWEVESMALEVIPEEAAAEETKP